MVDLDTYSGAAAGLAEFIAAGHHGTMQWMEDTQARRAHPQNMWPEAKSAVVLAMNYGPDVDPMAGLLARETGLISVYARGDDYHEVIKGRLKEIAGLIARDHSAQVKVFVDTAPLMEKPLAMAAGIGWQGKHTNLVSREFGSWLFLGVILTDAHLAPRKSEIDHCGTCTSCLDICPTRAFPAPYKIDARRCISYLTIEHDGPVDEELRAAIGNRIYGCDDCLAVCPWNKFAAAGKETRLAAREEAFAPPLSQLATLGEDGFRRRFRKSPIKRIGWQRFLRNVLYAIGNSGAVDLRPIAASYTNHDNEMISDAANWAMQRLQGAD